MVVTVEQLLLCQIFEVEFRFHKDEDRVCRITNIGSRGGTEQVTLSITQIPSHNHLIAGGGDGAKLSTERAVRKTPIAGDIPAVTTTKSGLADVEVKSFGPENANSVNAGTASSGGGTIGNTGGNMGHTNVQPFLTVSYIIALQGIFPSRN